MKVAVLGKGKTGSKVIDVLNEQRISYSIFDSNHRPTFESLKGHSVVISFLASEPFSQYVELFIESNLMVVSGTTGFTYSHELKKILKEKKQKWIVANNFSLGMNLIHQMIKTLGKAELLVIDPEYKIHEVHHTKKLDAPSGTALSWEKWLGHKTTITSDRIGDVIGFHEITLTTATEEIKLSHNALDRKIFAEGAVWAAKKLCNNHSIPYGLNNFQDIVETIIEKE